MKTYLLISHCFLFLIMSTTVKKSKSMLFLQLLSAIIIVIIPKLCVCQKEFDFNQHQTAIWFNPLVSKLTAKEPYHYRIEVLLNMVELVAQKFRNFFVPLFENDSTKLVPIAVAMYNQFIRNHSQPPLELWLLYEVDDNLKNQTIVKLTLEQVLLLADQANAIFENTVTTIFVQSTFSGDYLFIEQQLQLAFQFFDQLNTTYQIGLYMDFAYSGGLVYYMKKQNWPGLSRVKNILFFEHIDNNALEQPRNLFENLQGKFIKVKNRIRQGREVAENLLNKTMKVSIKLLTGYRGIPGNDDATLVLYWQLFNNWTVETDNFIVFYEAFDTVNANLTKNRRYEWPINRGWWQLVPNETYLDSEDFQFKEKIAEIDYDAERQNFDKTAGSVNEDTGSKTISIIVGSTAIVGVLVLGIAISFYIYYRKLFRKSARQKLIRKEIKNFLTKEKGHRNELEISKESFEIDKLHILGSGNYGVVCSAQIIMTGGIEEQVAVKMTNEYDNMVEMLGLINEIKVLSYLGHHENIVKLLGAYTLEALIGKSYVFLELCKSESLETVLRQYNPTELNHENDFVGLAGDRKLTREMASNLFRWATDIVNGMTFVASKMVVHADLATRNVLLRKDNRAVICDFGLSVILNESTSFTKPKMIGDICWRWAAPESIKDGLFNEKTDIWSFGVTLWEIFSLGEIPFADTGESKEHLRQLLLGRKLLEPLYSQHNIYEKVMTSCWNFNPTLRPTFVDLAFLFGELTKIYVTIL